MEHFRRRASSARRQCGVALCCCEPYSSDSTHATTEDIKSAAGRNTIQRHLRKRLQGLPNALGYGVLGARRRPMRLIQVANSYCMAPVLGHRSTT
jgi:hypothetical protein